jgi:hypothetical protein
MTAGSDSMAQTLARAAAFSGVLAVLLECLIVLVITRGMSVFHAEIEKIDALVSEYIKCRDVLLATRAPSQESGWRTAEAGAFREAWTNFNLQLEKIRNRFLGREKSLWIMMYVALPLLGVDLVNGAWPRRGAGNPMALIGLLSGALVGLILWFATFQILRRLKATILKRTTGDYLLAPWPVEGLSTERQQMQAFEKFLPVDGPPSSPGPAPEVL